MELIIKTTGKCNFACDFCMAGNENIRHEQTVSNDLKNLINVLKPQQLILNGGEPLLSGKQYFEDLLKIFDGDIAIISNLKDFYIRPEYWSSLFKNNRISITTSFQFGSGRKWDYNTVYTAQKFKEVCELFKKNIGYIPMFISVISTENENMALDHVYLAKSLNTVCKLNPMLPIGISQETFPFYKMIDIWLKIKELGLEKYTDAAVQFYGGGCSFNTCLKCESTIRVFYHDNNGKICYGNCDNGIFLGYQLKDIDLIRPEQKQSKLDIFNVISKKCLSCELCRLCNACKINKMIALKDKNYCFEMLKRKQKILKSGWYL